MHPGGSNCSLEAEVAAWRQIAGWRLRLQPGGSDCSLEAQIAAWKMKTKMNKPTKMNKKRWNSTNKRHLSDVRTLESTLQWREANLYKKQAS